VSSDVDVDIAAHGDMISRGGPKLEAALSVFSMSVDGRVAVDVGASTGGFTDVLLRCGAIRVYAIDVGSDQLADQLRTDPRVVVMEHTNFRTVESLPESPDLATVDVSFISVCLILPVLANIVATGAQAVILIKPQFEAGKDRVGKIGVVRDPSVHREVLRTVFDCAMSCGWGVVGLIASPLRGPAGNREFLAHLKLGERSVDSLEQAIKKVVALPHDERAS